MWYGLDPETRRTLAWIKQATKRRHQTPTGEWPVVFIEEHDAMLVIRQWPDGELTAFLMRPS